VPYEVSDRAQVNQAKEKAVNYFGIVPERHSDVGYTYEAEHRGIYLEDCNTLLLSA